MHWRLTLFLVFLVSSLKGADSTYVLQGRVFDASTQEPLVAANIIYGRSQGVITDSKGFYRINTPQVNLNVTFQYVGYRPISRTVHFKDGSIQNLDIRLEPEALEIEQIVVSAGKIEQKLSNLTVSMSLIKPEDILNTLVSDAEELINKTTGIEVMDGQASIRGGSGFSYGAGSRVLALIDGLPMVSADAGNIKWQFLPLENLSQVEIIKGASSVLYGSSALNGIINFRTADAGPQPVTNIITETGIYGKPRNNDWIWWDTPRGYASASFSHLQKSGNTSLGIGSHFLSDQGYRRLNDEKLGRMNLSLKRTHPGKENIEYGVKVNAGLTRKQDFILWENAEDGALKQDTSSAQVLHGTFLTIDPFFSLKQGTEYRHDVRMRFQSSQNNFPDNSSNNSDAYSFYTEYQYWMQLNNFVALNAGASGTTSRVNSQFYGNHNGINLAGYTQFDIKASERLKLIAGIRLEFNSLDGVNDKPTPVFRTGLNFRMADYTFLRASFGQGYRYPSVAEKHASTTLGSVSIIPNPFVLPETGWNSEIGIKQGIQAGKWIGQADLAVFHSQNRNMIEYAFGLWTDPVTQLPVLGFQAGNTEQSRVYGFEFESGMKRTAGIFNTFITGGYIFMYPVEFNAVNRQNTGDFLKYRRKHSAKLLAGAEWRNYSFGVNLYGNSKILRIDDVFIKPASRESILPGFYDYWLEHQRGYLLADASLGYNFSEKLGISFALKNLGNIEYMGRPGDIRPQRSFVLKLNGKF